MTCWLKDVSVDRKGLLLWFGEAAYWTCVSQSLAVDISLAALLGDNVYNFGELLLHPIVRSPPFFPSMNIGSLACTLVGLM